MNKSLESRRMFKASNKRMLDAVKGLADSGNNEILEKIDFVMDVSAYEYLIDNGLYKSLKREKGDRRSVDRRETDRRREGKR